jgi:anti-sigma factor RsiW
MNAREPDEPLVARDATYYRAPEALRERLRGALAREAREERQRTSRRGFLLAAAFAGVAVVSWNVALLVHSPEPVRLAGELVDAHLRSLGRPGRLFDVESTDRHTVKPWFAGKLPFAPDVIDAQAAGFTLLGGRVDYLEGQPVAALSYRYRLHVVNVFERPVAPPRDEPARVDSRRGFSLVHWTRGGLEYYAVSDLASGELAAIAR